MVARLFTVISSIYLREGDVERERDGGKSEEGIDANVSNWMKKCSMIKNVKKVLPWGWNVCSIMRLEWRNPVTFGAWGMSSVCSASEFLWNDHRDIGVRLQESRMDQTAKWTKAVSSISTILGELGGREGVQWIWLGRDGTEGKNHYRMGEGWQ